MSELDWRPFTGKIDTNHEFVLVLMPKDSVSGRIQSCRIKNGEPFVIGSIFAWDWGMNPTHWAPYPAIPAE